MKIKQLSVFLENKPGSLSAACRLLAKGKINLQTCTLADTQQFGILRLIVQDWERAKEMLEKNGCVVKVTEVVAIDVDDQPGGLATILEALEGTSINVEYMYAFAGSQKALLVFRFDKPDEAIKQLQTKGIKVTGRDELSKALGVQPKK
jgi:hypothetical protein